MKLILVFALTVALVVLATTAVPAQTVVKHMRLGNMTESMSYISTGPNAGTIAIEDGMQLVGFPADGRGNSQPRTLFDFSKLGFTAQPTGFGYMSDEHLFVFTQPPHNGPTATLSLSDAKGNSAGNVVFTWPADFADGNPYPEGIVWIPKSEPRYGGNFVFAGFQNATGNVTHFFVVDRSGNLVAEIIPNVDPNNVFLYVTGLAYWNGHLIAGLVDQTLWEFDLDGNVTAGPFQFNDLFDIEGVAVATHSGRIVITSQPTGKLVFLDYNYNRLPEDRSYKVGLGLGNVKDAAWDSDTNEFLVDSLASDPNLGLPEIGAINSDWTSARQVLSLDGISPPPLRIDYLPDTHALAFYRRSPLPRGFYYFDSNGNPVGDDPLPNSLIPGTFSYIPTTQQFAIRKNSVPNVIYIYDRSNLFGPPVRTIDLSVFGITSITNFTFAHPDDPSGGQFAVIADSKLFVFDFVGNLVAQYANPQHLNSIRAISSGRYAGDFVGMYTPNDEIFIVTLP